MKIAIYETVHLDWIIPLCELFSGQNHELSFFTSTELEDDIKQALNIQYQQFHWTYLAPEASWQTHYSRLHSFFQSSNFDLVILNSVDSRHILVFLALGSLRNKRILINLHDVNNFFMAGYTASLKTNVRTVGKKLLANIADGYIVNAHSMKEYIQDRDFTKKPVYWLPPVISKAEHPSLPRPYPLVIVIPGSVDERRRDYILALDVFEKAVGEDPASAQLVLAGRPVGEYGQTIINKARELSARGLNLSYFDHQIKETEFQELISRSHLVFSPMKITSSIHDKIEETYGKSKNTGNIYDAIRHGKPLLIPAAVIIPAEIKTSCIGYDSKVDLVRQLSVLINSQADMNTIAAAALSNAQKFRLEETRKKLEEILGLKQDEVQAY